MRNLLPIVFSLLALLAVSCSSGKRVYEQGNYYAASLKAVERLQRNPDHRKSAEVLASAYPMAVKTTQEDILHLQTLQGPQKWKGVVLAYERMNTLYDNIRRSPGALQVIPNPQAFHAPLRDARQKAAAESYALGERELQIGSREAARQAFAHFQDVMYFVPDYLDTRDKLAEAHDLATLKVLIEQIPVPGRYSIDAAFFADQLESFLANTQNDHPFVRFYNPREADDIKLQPHQYLRVQFNEFTIGETHTIQKQEALRKDSVVVGTVKITEDSTINVYGTVDAKLNHFRKEVISRGEVSLYIVDSQTGNVLRHQRFPSEFVWFSEWGYFNGDERALEDEHLAICKQKEVPPPPPQDMFVAFAKPIFNQLTREFNQFYAGY